MADARIGISGWIYPRWRGVFYPKGLAQKQELRYAASTFRTVEINGSFYSLQRPESYRRWRDETPADFVFAVKGGRFITHMKKLNDVEVPLANFFASGLLALGPKLGPILWQFPPNFGFNRARFETFFQLLPRDTREASRLAKKHDAKLRGRSLTVTKGNHPIRHAVEIRHESFQSPEFYRLLKAHGIACVVADTANRWPFIEEVTADFVYARLHGHEELYVSGYDSATLDEWAKRVKRWLKRKLDVYVYFDNDAKVHAPFDALSLVKRL